MVINAAGEISNVISLLDKASKGKSGRVIPMNRTLRLLLTEYPGGRVSDLESYVIKPERSEKFSANAVAVFFKRLYKKLGLVGCSSHSGRRTFITKCARKVSLTGGSIRDVMMLSGHKNLASVQAYIDQDESTFAKATAGQGRRRGSW